MLIAVYDYDGGFVAQISRFHFSFEANCNCNKVYHQCLKHHLLQYSFYHDEVVGPEDTILI